jgi:hypothetical protein
MPSGDAVMNRADLSGDSGRRAPLWLAAGASGLVPATIMWLLAIGPFRYLAEDEGIAPALSLADALLIYGRLILGAVPYVILLIAFMAYAERRRWAAPVIGLFAGFGAMATYVLGLFAFTAFAANRAPRLAELPALLLVWAVVSLLGMIGGDAARRIRYRPDWR